jgi:hypothetical protein
VRKPPERTPLPSDELEALRSNPVTGRDPIVLGYLKEYRLGSRTAEDVLGRLIVALVKEKDRVAGIALEAIGALER